MVFAKKTFLNVITYIGNLPIFSDERLFAMNYIEKKVESDLFKNTARLLTWYILLYLKSFFKLLNYR